MDDFLRKKLAEGQTAIGIMLSELYVPNIARIIAKCGYDYVLIDCEHGYFDMTQVANIIAVAQGVNLPVLVRVTQPSRTNITKYLDMGANGILLSDVADREAAERLVALCKYAPRGTRGVSTFRAHTDYSSGNVRQLLEKANDSIIVICQIESPEMVEKIDDIVSIPDVDGVLIGPNDLSQHMGILGQYDHPDMVAAVKRVAQSAHANGKWSGIITANSYLLELGKSCDMGCYSIGSELNALHDGAKNTLQRFEGMLR